MVVYEDGQAVCKMGEGKDGQALSIGIGEFYG